MSEENLQEKEKSIPEAQPIGTKEASQNVSNEEGEVDKKASEASTEEAVLEVGDTEKQEAETKDAQVNDSVSEEAALESTDDEKSDEEEVSSSDEEETDETEVEEKAQKDYHSLSKKELISTFKSLLKDRPIQELKHDVEEIRTEFISKFNEELEHKKEEFLAEGGNIIDFHYSTPIKKEFSSLYFDYKEKRNNYYKNLKQNLQENLKKRLALIEELKGLLNAEESINSTYKHFKEIQESWHTSGAIPRDKYNNVWNTYHHHVENFYDFLHLNREFRDLDFKHNLEQKLKLIGRAEELAQQDDVSKAFRELQMLHKMWKEEIGPVAKEYREDVWDKFSAATKIIHDKRQDYLKDQEKHFQTNFESKSALIEEIQKVTSETASNHKAWQAAMRKVQELRDSYFNVGKVPRSNTKEIWSNFKAATLQFNRTKNAFYKNQKKEQYTNLEKKLELIRIADENKDGEDFNVITPLMKKIQNDWKGIGHVPRKDSDKIWKQFKSACNHYFDRLHAQRNEDSKEELENFEAKSKFLESLENLKLEGTKEENIATIKTKIADWKDMGRVPFNKRNINKKFNKVLDGLFGKLDLAKKEGEMIRFENKLNVMASQEDNRKLQNEEFFISKKIGEVKNELRQLENNLGFFQNVKSDNPLVKDVHKNIDRQKEQLEVWKAKLSKIRALRKEQ